MRYMIIVKATEDSEAGVLPTSEEIATMGRFNEELIASGVMLAGEGLQASAHGARIRFGKDGPVVTDGPFSETKELIAGFWIIDVKSYDEALAWAKKAPMGEGHELELRKVFEASDFPVDSVSEEHLRKEQAWREANQKPIGQ